MKVTGEAASPVLTISIDKNGVKETGSNATSDAIAFLLFGKFSDQLSFGESSSFGAALGASYLSNYVSSSTEQILPWLINTSIGYVDNKGGTLAPSTRCEIYGSYRRCGYQIRRTDIQRTCKYGHCTGLSGKQAFKNEIPFK